MNSRLLVVMLFALPLLSSFAQPKTDRYVKVKHEMKRSKTPEATISQISVSVFNARYKAEEGKEGKVDPKSNKNGPVYLRGTLYCIFQHGTGNVYSVERGRFSETDVRLGRAAKDLKTQESERNKRISEARKKNKKYNPEQIMLDAKDKFETVFEVHDVKGEKQLVDYILSVHCNGRWIFCRGATSTSRWMRFYDRISRVPPGMLVNSQFEKIVENKGIQPGEKGNTEVKTKKKKKK